MSSLYSISQLLPYQFKNGVIVSRFAKICTGCNKAVEANAIVGNMVAVHDHLLISAHVHCPHCERRFPISCIINNKREVQQVILPHFSFRWLMRTMASARVTPEHASSLSHIPLFESVRAHSLPTSEVTEAKLQVGRYDGMPIPAWIEYHGQRLDFVRVIPPNLWPTLSEEERIYRRKMVFRVNVPEDDQLQGA